MLRHIHVESMMFDGADDREETEKDLCFFLEALTQRNQDYLARRPSTPRLYKSGVVYSRPNQFDGDCDEVKTLKAALGRAARHSAVRKVLQRIQDVFGGEHFCDIGVIMELGSIDCDGLACWRAAELRQMGIPAHPYMTSRSRLDGGVTYHALVRWPPFWFGSLGSNEATSEDPSLLLGMSQPQRASDRQEEIRKNKERCLITRQVGLAGLYGGGVNTDAAESVIEDVLGLRPRRRMVSGEAAIIEQLLRRVA